MCLGKVLSKPIDVIEVTIGLVVFLRYDNPIVERVIIKSWSLMGGI